MEQLVPADNFYRELENKLDLSFTRDLVHQFYAPGGRPSVDPIVFFKLKLIMLLEGIRSERRLLEQAHLHLAWRWYQGYDLDEPLPDHSSLTKIRERYGLAVFRQFFEQIVTRCINLGVLVTPAEILDHTPMLDLLRWGRFRWAIHPRIAVCTMSTTGSGVDVPKNTGHRESSGNPHLSQRYRDQYNHFSMENFVPQ